MNLYITQLRNGKFFVFWCSTKLLIYFGVGCHAVDNDSVSKKSVKPMKIHQILCLVVTVFTFLCVIQLAGLESLVLWFWPVIKEVLYEIQCGLSLYICTICCMFLFIQLFINILQFWNFLVAGHKMNTFQWTVSLLCMFFLTNNLHHNPLRKK